MKELCLLTRHVQMLMQYPCNSL